VVIPDGAHRRETAQALYCGLSNLGFAKDFVVATEGDLRTYGDDPSLVYWNALHEGRELYRAA
jgi:hypothetical protein